MSSLYDTYIQGSERNTVRINQNTQPKGRITTVVLRRRVGWMLTVGSGWLAGWLADVPSHRSLTSYAQVISVKYMIKMHYCDRWVIKRVKNAGDYVRS